MSDDSLKELARDIIRCEMDDLETYNENSKAIYNEGFQDAVYLILKDLSKYVSNACGSDQLDEINKIRAEWGLSWDEFVKKIVYMWAHEKEITELRERDLSELIELKRD